MIVFPKMINLIKVLIFFVTLSFINEVSTKDFLKEAISNENRKVENVKRDKHRNPYETLNFFGINKEMKILEITPGRGWYTEILAKYMKNSNNFYIAKYDPPQFAVEILTKIQDEFEKYFAFFEFSEIQRSMTGTTAPFPLSACCLCCLNRGLATG